jgi:1-acyl-sn-glycerol-3-phosphate acyltransferase
MNPVQAADISRRLKAADGETAAILNAPGAPAGVAVAPSDVVLLYAGSRAELEARAAEAMAVVKPGGRLWVAYPADGSADLNRNHGWGALNRARMTATEDIELDAAWRATRFEPLATVPAAEIPRADMLPVGRRARPLFRVVRAVAIPLFHLLFRFRVDGREHVPNRAYVLIANHLGWMDAISLLLLFPAEPRIHFLADPTSMMRNRPLWLLVRGAGGIVPVDRAQRDQSVLFSQVGRCLERGGVIALFPEGDFGPGEGRLLPFKRGFARFAIDGRVPVLPVGMSGMRELWLGKRLQLRIGAPIQPDGRTVEELLSLGQDAVAALLPEYRDPGGRKPLRRWLTGLF